MQKILNIFPIAILALVLLFSGHSYAQGMTEEELATQRILDRMNALEKSMATMQQELYKSGKSITKKVSDAPVGDEEERTRAMNGKFEEVEHHISVLATKLDKIIADIDFRLTALEKTVSANAAAAAAANTNNSSKPADGSTENKTAQNAPVDTASATKPDAESASTAAPSVAPAAVAAATSTSTTTPAKTDEKKPAIPASKPKADVAAQYEKAFEFLRLSKYDAAEKAFKDFISNNKGSDLIGNAYYWLGETYLSRENYQQAAVQFLKGYQDFPKGNKAPDSLLKLAVSLRSLQKEKEACATLDKLKKEYPKMDKDLLTKASAERKGLKCKAPE